MFDLSWTPEALSQFRDIEKHANKKGKRAGKSSRQEGLFNQLVKALKFLSHDPRHPGLKTHPYSILEHPWSKNEKVFEAYVQNNTPGAYRIFWCYGPQKNMITIIAITPHP